MTSAPALLLESWLTPFEAARTDACRGAKHEQIMSNEETTPAETREPEASPTKPESAPAETATAEPSEHEAQPAPQDANASPSPNDASATDAGANANADAPAAAESGDAAGEGDDGDDASEGEGEEAATAEGGAANAAPEGGAPAKKKRRRRRKKKPHAPGEGEAAAAPGAEGASTEEGAESGAEEGGAEGEKKKRRPPPNREVLPFRVGEEVFGKVERVTDDAIWIDVAGKALGLFDRRELGEGEPPSEGDQFIATVASHGVRGGMLRMSRAPLMIDDAKKKVEAAKDAGEPVEGFVTGAVKGGIEVDIDGLRAFAPASHVDMRPGADLSHLVGRRLNFIVVQYEKKGRDVVVSRKKFLADEAHQARADALKSLEPGSIHQGVVRTVVQWGVFVALTDAGGIEGLVHASEASHDRSAKLTDLFKPGDHVEVKIVRVDEKGKLWLSRKSIVNDPWDAVKEKYAVGSRHTGRVARIQPFGAFIELEPGIDGLAYTADLSFKPIQHPNDILKVDDPIEVVVATCDGPTRKISLHAAPPADEADEPRPKVGPHRILKVAVVSQSEAGLVVRLIGLSGRAARGFIPAGHTGTQRGTDLRKAFPAGTKLEAKVLEVDARRGETKLSIRAMREDSEKQAYQEYRASVAREAKFGTFADLLKK
jgi:small subunit ribosomal protein S1